MPAYRPPPNRLAAAQGNTAAQTNLGAMYHLGLGVAKDDAQAAKWYQAPAKQGDIIAEFMLAQIYKQGDGVRQDLPEAVRLFEKCVSQGSDQPMQR